MNNIKSLLPPVVSDMNRSNCNVISEIIYEKEYSLKYLNDVVSNKNDSYITCNELKKSNPNYGTYHCYSNIDCENFSYDLNMISNIKFTILCDKNYNSYYKYDLEIPNKWNYICEDPIGNASLLYSMTVNEIISYDYEIFTDRNNIYSWKSMEVLGNGTYLCYDNNIGSDLIMDDGYYECQLNKLKSSIKVAYTVLVLFIALIICIIIFIVRVVLSKKTKSNDNSEYENLKDIIDI